MRKVFCVACAAVGVSLFAVTAAFPLWNSVVSRIRQASTSEQLASQAESIVRDEASIRPKDFQEGTQIAAETSAISYGYHGEAECPDSEETVS